MEKILFDEQGLIPGTPFEKGQWKNISTHSDAEIKGFFGEYRFLSNFWPAEVMLDDVVYSSVENAYQAAKYPKDIRGYFQKCTAKEAIVYVREHPLNEELLQRWEELKLGIMEKLLLQKFDERVHQEMYQKLQETKGRVLEETNYWGDKFWGVHKTDVCEPGVGENNLGKLLMKVRDN